MDANKIDMLRESHYTVGKCCALCASFRPGVKSPLWGTCKRHLYQHGKHTGDRREASVMACGSCPSFDVDDARATALLGRYRCLLEEEI